jgi:hypothetical protein
MDKKDYLIIPLSIYLLIFSSKPLICIVALIALLLRIFRYHCRNRKITIEIPKQPLQYPCPRCETPLANYDSAAAPTSCPKCIAEDFSKYKAEVVSALESDKRKSGRIDRLERACESFEHREFHIRREKSSLKDELRESQLSINISKFKPHKIAERREKQREAALVRSNRELINLNHSLRSELDTSERTAQQKLNKSQEEAKSWESIFQGSINGFFNSSQQQPGLWARSTQYGYGPNGTGTYTNTGNINNNGGQSFGGTGNSNTWGSAGQTGGLPPSNPSYENTSTSPPGGTGRTGVPSTQTNTGTTGSGVTDSGTPRPPPSGPAAGTQANNYPVTLRAKWHHKPAVINISRTDSMVDLVEAYCAQFPVLKKYKTLEFRFNEKSTLAMDSNSPWAISTDSAITIEKSKGLTLFVTGYEED